MLRVGVLTGAAEAPLDPQPRLLLFVGLTGRDGRVTSPGLVLLVFVVAGCGGGGGADLPVCPCGVPFLLLA